MADKARIAAFELTKRMLGGAYSNLVKADPGLSPLDRSFAERIALGTLERKLTLEFILNKFVKSKTDGSLFILLMNGVYQIMYMDRVPDSASCNETVEIAAKFFGKSGAGFANAVLRNTARNKESLMREVESAGGHIVSSMNKDLYDLLGSQYPGCIGEICSALFGKSDCFVRVNTLLTDAEEVAALLQGEAISDRCVKTSDHSLAVNNLEKGLYFIQGEGSQRAVETLGAREGETVVDVCACPGGKSLGAAIDMRGIGRIYSFDLHQKKLPLIVKSANTLGIKCIYPSVYDARFTKNDLINKADRVICDVPCSGTGEMASKPEIKYKDPSDFAGLYATQRAIIKAASLYLKTGGVMVYSTCSINREENSAAVEAFLDENKGFSLCGEVLTLPGKNRNEGFYTAKIIREK